MFWVSPWTCLWGTCLFLFVFLTLSFPCISPFSWKVPEWSFSFCILSSPKTAIASPISFKIHLSDILWWREGSYKRRDMSWWSNRISLDPNVCQFTTYPGKRKRSSITYTVLHSDRKKSDPLVAMDILPWSQCWHEKCTFNTALNAMPGAHWSSPLFNKCKLGTSMCQALV